MTIGSIYYNGPGKPRKLGAQFVLTRSFPKQNVVRYLKGRLSNLRYVKIMG